MGKKVDEAAALLPVFNRLLRTRERQLNDQLESVKAGLDFLSRAPDITFRVQLTSLWADYGEKTVESKGKGPLKNIIKRAETRFKALNKRGDVQAKYQAWALLGENKVPSCSVPIPDEFIRPHCEKR